MSCDSASRPLAASVGRGVPTSRSGSTIASRASMGGLRRLAFTAASVTVSTALRVTSALVPAVVGTATQGTAGRCRTRPRPTVSR